MMDTIKFNNKDYEILEVFKSKKLHVKRKDKEFIIIPFSSYNDYSIYIGNKKILKKNKVESSKLLKKDKHGLMVLEEYINGVSVSSIIANNEMEKYFPELFRIYRNNRFAKIALDYRPNNFVLKGKYFYYIVDDVFGYNPKRGFELTQDFLLWINCKESKKYIENLGYEYKDRKLYKEGGELNKAIALVCVSNW